MSLEDVNVVAGDPGVDLLEAFLQDAFVGLEKCEGAGMVRIDAHAQQFVTIACAAIFPRTTGTQQVFGYSPEAVTQMIHRGRELLILDCRAVVIGQRQADFESRDQSRSAQGSQESTNAIDYHPAVSDLV